MLRNIQYMKTVVNKDKRWSMKFHKFQPFIYLGNDLLEISYTDGVVLNVDRSVQFTNKARKYEKMMREIDQITLILQRRGATHCDFRLMLVILVDSVSNESKQELSSLCRFRFDKYYISPWARIDPNSHFESVVVKIQRKQSDMMSDTEKEACASLRSDANADSSEKFSTNNSRRMLISEKISW